MVSTNKALAFGGKEFTVKKFGQFDLTQEMKKSEQQKPWRTGHAATIYEAVLAASRFRHFSVEQLKVCILPKRIKWPDRSCSLHTQQSRLRHTVKQSRLPRGGLHDSEGQLAVG
jgi:hypothetical protein